MLPTLSLTGGDGNVYSIQYASGFSPTTAWIDQTLVQAKASPMMWSDPTPSTSGCRFYLVVWFSNLLGLMGLRGGQDFAQKKVGANEQQIAHVSLEGRFRGGWKRGALPVREG